MVKRRNVLGIIAFILVLVAYVTPLVTTILGFVVASPDPTGLVTDQGWAWVSALFWAFVGLVIAGILAFVALGLGIGSLFVKFAGRVLGIIAICLSALPVLALLFVIGTSALTSVGQ